MRVTEVTPSGLVYVTDDEGREWRFQFGKNSILTQQKHDGRWYASRASLATVRFARKFGGVSSEVKDVFTQRPRRSRPNPSSSMTVATESEWKSMSGDQRVKLVHDALNAFKPKRDPRSAASARAKFAKMVEVIPDQDTDEYGDAAWAFFHKLTVPEASAVWATMSAEDKHYALLQVNAFDWIEEGVPEYRSIGPTVREAVTWHKTMMGNK